MQHPEPPAGAATHPTIVHQPVEPEAIPHP